MQKECAIYLNGIEKKLINKLEKIVNLVKVQHEVHKNEKNATFLEKFALYYGNNIKSMI